MNNKIVFILFAMTLLVSVFLSAAVEAVVMSVLYALTAVQ